MEELNVLLVEDNEGDIVLTLEAFAEGKFQKQINVVRDGLQALDYLYKRNGFENAVTPNFIVLDLNLPKIDGKEVLEILKKDPIYKKIPIVVLTTSALEKDVIDSYDRHANCFITKP